MEERDGGRVQLVLGFSSGVVSLAFPGLSCVPVIKGRRAQECLGKMGCGVMPCNEGAVQLQTH